MERIEDQEIKTLCEQLINVGQGIVRRNIHRLVKNLKVTCKVDDELAERAARAVLLQVKLIDEESGENVDEAASNSKNEVSVFGIRLKI